MHPLRPSIRLRFVGYLDKARFEVPDFLGFTANTLDYSIRKCETKRYDVSGWYVRHWPAFINAVNRQRHSAVHYACVTVEVVKR